MLWDLLYLNSFFFLLETRDVYINVKENMRRMRSLLHNYQKLKSKYD